jgi:hypothetical protein
MVKERPVCAECKTAQKQDELAVYCPKVKWVIAIELAKTQRLCDFED